jgi:hypothetical protein
MRKKMTPVGDRFHWTRVLPVLGIHDHASLATSSVSCGICHQDRMLVFEDQVLGGPWFYCNRCEFSGDAFALASRVWQSDLQTASLRLILGLFGKVSPSDPLARDVAVHCERVTAPLQRAASFWKTCQAAGPGRPAPILQRLWGIPTDYRLGLDLWLQRGGRLIGTTTTSDVDAALDDRHVEPRVRTLRNNAPRRPRSRIFPGSGWDGLLVVPYHDLPGRICGFLFVGRNGRWPDDYVWYPVLDAGVVRQQPSTGLAMFDAVWSNTGPPVVLTGDPRVALKMQLDALQHQSVGLQLAALWSGAESVASTAAPALKALRRPAVLVDLEERPDVVRLALDTGSQISEKRTPVGIAGTLAYAIHCKHAVDPERAAARRLVDCSPDRVADQLLKMSLQSGERRRLANHLPDTLAESVHQESDSDRIVQLGTLTVIESGRVWRDSRHRPLSDAVVRIDRLVHFPGKPHPSVSGRVIFRDRSVPFQGTLPERGLLRLISQACLSAGSVPPIFDPTIRNRVQEIAQLIEPPAVCVGLTEPGWDDPSASLRFPRVTIGHGGRIDPPLPSAGDLPGQCFSFPESLILPARVALLHDDPGIAAGWVGLAGFAAALLAPAFRSTPSRLIVTGEAAVMGVRGIYSGLEATSAAIYRAWPVLPPPQVRPGPEFELVEKLPPGGAMVVRPETLETLTAFSGWAGLADDRTPDAAMFMGFRQQAAGFFLVYLQDLMSRHLALEHCGCFLASLLTDMGHWVKRLCGRPSPAITEALTNLQRDTPAAHAVSVVALLRRLPGDAILPEKDRHWVSTASIRALEVSLGRPAIPMAQIVAALDAVGALITRSDRKGQDGLLLRSDWAQGRLRKDGSSSSCSHP